MNIIDARNKPCPKPVMMVKKAVEAGDQPIQVILNSEISATNVKRFMETQGFKILEENKINEEITLTFTKNIDIEQSHAPDEVQVELSSTKDTALLITTAHLGKNDAELGEVLMKGFLNTIAEMPHPPKVIALMNEGVLLALHESSTSESLSQIEDKGCRILVCGTCTNHFGVTEKVKVGTISNMYEITEHILESQKTITIS